MICRWADSSLSVLYLCGNLPLIGECTLCFAIVVSRHANSGALYHPTLGP